MTPRMIENRVPQVKSNNQTLEIISHLEAWNDLRALDVQIEWTVENLIPKGGISLIIGRGGVGKTFVALQIAQAIGNGTQVFGLDTIPSKVFYIDFENPEPVIVSRLKMLGGAENIHFLRGFSENFKAPKLDSKDWEDYMKLPKDSVIIIDTLRSSQGGDENGSRDMSIVLEHLKILRETGFTIIVLHHTPKSSDTVSKGSSAIVDLADNELSLSVNKENQIKGAGKYYFGNEHGKTRYEKFSLHLDFVPREAFVVAKDPRGKHLEKIHEILVAKGPMNKSELVTEVKKIINIGEKRARTLIDEEKGTLWQVEREGGGNTQMVTALKKDEPPILDLPKLKEPQTLQEDETELQDELPENEDVEDDTNHFGPTEFNEDGTPIL